jgi:hypothetical protein
MSLQLTSPFPPSSGDRISPDVLLASAKAMSSFAIPCAVGGPVIDVVGTGGDSVDTFNASTAAALYVNSIDLKIFSLFSITYLFLFQFMK